MGKSVVVKKEEKVKKIFEELGKDCSLDDFAEKFKTDYPSDWNRINQVYMQHERNDTKGKGHPMPEPSQYMKNMYNIGKTKFNNK